MKKKGFDILLIVLVLSAPARAEVEVKDAPPAAEVKPASAPEVPAPLMEPSGTPERANASMPSKPEPDSAAPGEGMVKEEKAGTVKEEYVEPDELSEVLPDEEAPEPKPPENGETVMNATNPLESELEPPLPPLSDAMFRVREYDGDIELLTPWGNFVIPGEFGKRFGKDHFRFSIPVRDLMPEELKNPKPEEPPEEQPPQVAEEKKEEDTEAKSEARTPTALPPGNPLVTIDDSDRLIVDANRLYNQRRYYEALAVVDSLLHKTPESSRAWLMRGSLMLVQGHKDLALKSYEQALKLSPDDPEIRAIVERYK